MLRIHTVLLRHAGPLATHHDWLLENPADPAGPLLCFRVGPPSHAWADTRPLHLLRLPDHRRLYLHYQGPLTRRRGWVRRVDAGRAVVRLWRTDRAVLQITMHRFTGLVQLRATAKNRWIAEISP